NLPSGTTPGSPAQYVYSSLSGGLTINGRTLGGLGLVPVETYVTIVVGSAGSKTGDIGPITIGAGVNAKIYFTGSMNVKASDLANNNVDGAVGVFNADGTPSFDYSRPGNLQFYEISPTNGSMKTIAILPPGTFFPSFYATLGSIPLTG